MKIILGFMKWILEGMLGAVVLMLLVGFIVPVIPVYLFGEDFMLLGLVATAVSVLCWFVLYLADENRW